MAKYRIYSADGIKQIGSLTSDELLTNKELSDLEHERGIRIMLDPTEPPPFGTIATGLVETGIRGAANLGLTALGGYAGAARALGGWAEGESPDTAAQAGSELSGAIGGLMPRPSTQGGLLVESALTENVGRPLMALKEGLGNKAAPIGAALDSIGMTDHGEAAARTLGEISPDVAMTLLPVARMFKMNAVRGAGELTQAQRAISEAMDNGFLAEPGRSAPGSIRAHLPFVSSKIGQAMSVANQPRAKEMVLQSLDDWGAAKQRYPSMAKDDLTVKSLDDYREYIYDQYMAPIKAAGTKVPFDPKPISDAIMEMRGMYAEAKDTFTAANIGGTISKLESDIGTLKLRSNGLDIKALMQMARLLRQQKDVYFKKGELGADQARAYDLAAKAIDETLDNGLRLLQKNTKTVQPQYYDLKKYREEMAKSYTVQDITNTETGEVNPQELVRLVDRGDAPVTGPLRKLYQAAKTLETTMRKPNAPIPDSGAATKYGVERSIHNPATAAIEAFGPIIKGFAKSKYMQARPTNISTNWPMSAATAAGGVAAAPPPKENQSSLADYFGQ